MHIRDKVRLLDYWYRRIGTKTYSRKLDTQLRQAVKGLKDYPEMGRQLENTNIRFLVRDYYQIFYKFSKHEIKILHVLDSRRNLDDLVIKG